MESKVGLKELNPQPYWGYDDLGHKAGTKLKNVFLVEAQRKREKTPGGQPVERFRYVSCLMLSGFSPQRFIDLIGDGAIYVDFDARTGHNHGTKFRLRQNRLPDLYSEKTVIF